jgi:hypothetical protein
MSGDPPQRPNFCRFQKTRTAGTGGYVLNANGTMVGRHPEGFATGREARLDAERLRERRATAPIMGEVDEGTG